MRPGKLLQLLSLAVLCLAIALPFRGQTASQASPITNTDVIHQKQWGDSDAQIIARIKKNPTAFVFDGPSRDALTAAGVSMAVQIAMYESIQNSAIKATKAPSKPAANSSSQAPTQNQASPPVNQPDNSANGGGNSQGSTTPPKTLTAAEEQALAQVTVPSGCNAVPSPSADLQTAANADNSPLVMPPASPSSSWVSLNANSSGAEIYTKSPVYVEYINRLRYTASLGGVVTLISAPSLPSQLFPTSASPTQAPPTTVATKPPQPPPPQPVNITSPPPDQIIWQHFQQFIDCMYGNSTASTEGPIARTKYTGIQNEVSSFQGALAKEEAVLNSTTERIKNRLDSLQPIANSLGEAKGAADLSIFPANEIPSFPISNVSLLRGLLTEFSGLLSQFSEWANQNAQNQAAFDSTSKLADALGTTLDQYLVTSNSSTTGTTGTSGSTTADGSKQSAPGGATTGGTKPGSGGGTPTTGGTKPGSTGGTTTGTTKPASGGTTTGTNTGSTQPQSPNVLSESTEVTDYEQNRTFIQQWLSQFRTVAGANEMYFVVDYKPPCGGFFGQGTSTQMQLTIADNWDTTQKPSPTNLDKVVCEPALTITNGLGLSFISDQTPAFVAGVEKNAQGTPVLDSNGNPVITQTLGYSSTASVRPSYALQVNAVLWSPRHQSFEIHWSVGAMLTAATGGATTDIITGPALSFKRRAFFVSPVYDLGLRTDYQKGFTVGMPQGNLTSPPTQQFWRSGFGLTITFPFTSTTNTTSTSANTSGNPSQTSTQPKGGTTNNSNSNSTNKPKSGQ